jgi:hypothetical protein
MVAKPMLTITAINDSVKGFIEVFVPEENKPDKDELAELLNECDLEKCIEELLNNIFFFCKNQKVNRIAD